MRVKICGITSYQDAKMAIDEGADALGFLFYKKSPRYIEPLEVKKIISKLPPFIEKVGLFVNETGERIEEIGKFSNISLAQLHFEISDSEFQKISIPKIRVVRAKERSDLELFENEYRIVDAFVEEYGGAGKRVNPDWFKNRDNSKIILAGGLNSENLREIRKFGFYGVDVSSGVEISKGKKSKEKVRNFIQLIKKSEFNQN